MISSATAKISRAFIELWIELGTIASRKPGSGLSPSTLSTAMASGRGSSSASGVESRLISQIPKMCRQ
jgi:hypothetical protein